jgi:hypothetical protein
MKRLIMAAAAMILLFGSAIAREPSLSAVERKGWVKMAMGPVSAPQKRSAADYPKESSPTCVPFNDSCQKSWGGRKQKTLRY